MPQSRPTSSSGFDRQYKVAVDTTRQFRVVQQLVCLSAFDLSRACFVGFTELCVVPLSDELRAVQLNCASHVHVQRCTLNEQDDAVANTRHTDPLDSLAEKMAGNSGERSIRWLADVHYRSMSAGDPEQNNGELCIDIPDSFRELVAARKPFKIGIDFWVEKPSAGVQFVTYPTDEARPGDYPVLTGAAAEAADAQQRHVYTYRSMPGACCTREWLPCVDAPNELCLWRIEITTVDAKQTAVASGDLVDVCYTEDMRAKTYHFQLGVPTSAANIGWAMGNFDVHVEHEMSEVISLCQPGLLPILRHTVEPLHKIFEFFEELLSCRFPYGSYKQVFVDQAAEDVCSYAGVSITSVCLLHDASQIDAVQHSRTIMAHGVAGQFFGCFLSNAAWLDLWVLRGIARYITLLYIQHSFGHNEYLYQTSRVLQSVCDYERRHGPVFLRVLKGETRARDALHFDPRHAHTCSAVYFDVLCKKAHLILRMLEKRLGKEPLFHVLHKQLSQAQSASQQKQQLSAWDALLLSTNSFFDAVSSVTGQELPTFLELWVYGGGHAHFNVSFSYIRKRNLVEVEIKQDQPPQQQQETGNNGGIVSYIGPLSILVQEVDGSFVHTVNVDSTNFKADLPCTSKGRRQKKKRVAVSNGEEVEMDLSQADADSPILWLRLDPQMLIVRKVELRQHDNQWMYQLRYERDVVAQWEALDALVKYPGPPTRAVLLQTLQNNTAFYRVRIQSAFKLVEVANKLSAASIGPPPLLATYQKWFCSRSCPDIPKPNAVHANSFSLQMYFLMQALPQAMALLHTAQGGAYPEVLQFLANLLKYNDNHSNRFSDEQQRSVQLHALTQCVCAAGRATSAMAPDELTDDVRHTLAVVTRAISLDALQPSYQLIITCACLRSLLLLQRQQHLPINPDFWWSYADAKHFCKVRVTALDCLLSIALMPKMVNTGLYTRVLEYCVGERDAFVRYSLLKALIARPPFKHNGGSSSTEINKPHALDNSTLADTLWLNIANARGDTRLRCGLIDLYATLYGRQSPRCYRKRTSAGQSSSGADSKKRDLKAAMSLSSNGNTNVLFVPPITDEKNNAN